MPVSNVQERSARGSRRWRRTRTNWSALFLAVCGVANPRPSWAMAVVVRLAAHPKPGRPHSRGLVQRCLSSSLGSHSGGPELASVHGGGGPLPSLRFQEPVRQCRRETAFQGRGRTSFGQRRCVALPVGEPVRRHPHRGAGEDVFMNGQRVERHAHPAMHSA